MVLELECIGVVHLFVFRILNFVSKGNLEPELDSELELTKIGLGMLERERGVGLVVIVIVVVVPKYRTLRERSAELIDGIKRFRRGGMGVREGSS